MQKSISEYKDLFWCYNNPFQIDTDEYEKIVQEQMKSYGKKKPITKKQHSIPFNRKPPKRPSQTNAKSFNQQAKQANRANFSNGVRQTFVSSETKPLRITPRVIIHLPSPTSTIVQNENSNSTVHD